MAPRYQHPFQWLFNAPTITRMSELGGTTDGQAVRAILAGDTERYSELVTRYRDRYARYAARMLGSRDAAEDAVQDAFVRAYDQLAQCRDPDNFVGWFFLILRNRCFAERRKSKQVVPLEAAGAVASADRAEVPVEADEQRRSLQHALLELTPEQREVFVLKHVKGCRTARSRSDSRLPCHRSKCGCTGRTTGSASN